MFKRGSFRRTSNPPAPQPSMSNGSSSFSPPPPPPLPAPSTSNSSSLFNRFKPSPKSSQASLPPHPIVRSNTLPVIESTNSSRSSFTSVSSATREEEVNDAFIVNRDVWGEEEEEGRRPLVDLADHDEGRTLTDDDVVSSNENGNGHVTVHGGLSIDPPFPATGAPPKDIDQLSSSLPNQPSRPTSPVAPSPEVTTPKTHHPHTHHHAIHHSPPVAGPPPIRAATLSGLKDVAIIAAASQAQQQQQQNGKVKKKIGGGFMSSLSRKLKDPTLEGALALASLPAPPPAEQLTPQVRMERAKQAERAHLLQICMELGVEIYDIAPDGHCMYAAVADQLSILKIIKEIDNNPKTTRAAAADYMLAHPDSFMPFLVGSADLEFGEEDEGAPEGETEEERLERRRAIEDGMLSERGFRRYCERVRDSGEWGGEPEILALSRYYQIPIHVIQSNHPKIVAHSPDPKARATLDPKSARKIKAVRISYHRRLYGLGEHYNSLRKITYTLSAFSAMVPM